MTPTEPLPLNHSWPIFEAARRSQLPWLMSLAGGNAPFPYSVKAIGDALSLCGIGIWQCDLRDNRLSWSAGVYDLFGLPRGTAVTRDLAVSLYRPRSRAAMEQLRSYAIRHRRGFTVDAEIRRPDGDGRWMRLSAVPIIRGRRVVGLRGTKIDVTPEYEAPGH